MTYELYAEFKVNYLYNVCSTKEKNREVKKRKNTNELTEKLGSFHKLLQYLNQ